MASISELYGPRRLEKLKMRYPVNHAGDKRNSIFGDYDLKTQGQHELNDRDVVYCVWILGYYRLSLYEEYPTTCIMD